MAIEPKQQTERGLDLELWTVLGRAHDAVHAHVEADVRRHGLTLAEFAVLQLLYRQGPTLLCNVQKGIVVSSGGITYLVDQLEGKGLVERRECPEDRRARYAALTASGSGLMRRILPEHARAVARAVSGLNERDKRAAVRLIRRLGRRAAELLGEPGNGE